MVTSTHRDGAAPLTRDRLVRTFEGYGRPREQWLIGGEFERHLLDDDGVPVPYEGEHGVRWLLEELGARGAHLEVEDGRPIAALRGSASVTLEPGGQFELSGTPFVSVRELAAEARAFYDEIAEITRAHGIHQCAVGYTPFARIEDIGWVPKGRYRVMRDHLGATGDLAHAMMKGTAAVQATFDFADEEDAARKVQLAVKLGPLTTAMFANSPLREGRPTGFASWRGHVWTRTDPRRTGFPDAADHFTFAGWIDYLLDVPMMFTRVGGAWHAAGGRTFRSWMDEGIDGCFPGWADWELHLTSVFPEVRIKRQIEIRGADCVPLRLSLAFCALFKGLFYCRRALEDATELANRFASHGTKEERFDTACRLGLEGTVGAHQMSSWATDLLDITWRGLERCAPEDRPWLEPLMAQIASGRSPASLVLRAWESDPSPRAVIAATEYVG